MRSWMIRDVAWAGDADCTTSQMVMGTRSSSSPCLQRLLLCSGGRSRCRSGCLMETVDTGDEDSVIFSPRGEKSGARIEGQRGDQIVMAD